MKLTWERKAGGYYYSSDDSFMIKNVGFRCWGLFINDGSRDWDLNWVGSTYPSLKSAQICAAYWAEKGSNA